MDNLDTIIQAIAHELETEFPKYIIYKIAGTILSYSAIGIINPMRTECKCILSFRQNAILVSNSTTEHDYPGMITLSSKMPNIDYNDPNMMQSITNHINRTFNLQQ